MTTHLSLVLSFGYREREESASCERNTCFCRCVFVVKVYFGWPMNKIRTVLILIMEFWKCHFGGSWVFLSSRSTMRCHSSMIRPPYNTFSNIQDLKSIPFKIYSFEKNNIISSSSSNYTHLAKTSSHYSTPTLISGSPIRSNNKYGSSNWSAHRPFAKVLWWRRLRFLYILGLSCILSVVNRTVIRYS